MFGDIAFRRTYAVVCDLTTVLLILLLRSWRDVLSLARVYASWDWTFASGVAIVVIAVLFRLLRVGYARPDEPAPLAGGVPEKFLQPLIFPCQTTHTRLFPTKHSFSYSYLYVGIPVGWRGPAGSMLSADNSTTDREAGGSRWTWFTVEAEDYLERGSHSDGLRGKLRDYLSTQEVEIGQYSNAFLVTAPRFLGFSFNPVSFWYLYNDAGTLAAMILEVNNTFDERRMYFMQRPDSGPNGKEGSKLFRQAWDKDFHVSPFNDREGEYSLTAFDLANPDISGTTKLDNTIVLKSQDGKSKFVARVYSTVPPLAPKNLTNMQSLSFLLRWWWVGFMTNTRILREARILWVKKLQVFYRPEVFMTSIGRNETSDERILETVFRLFLQQLVDRSSIAIRYKAAAGHMRAKPETLASSYWQGQEEGTVIEFRVLTPAFYTQLARSPTILDAFERGFYQSDAGSKMLHISQPVLFKDMLDSFNVNRELRKPNGVTWRALAVLRNLNTDGLGAGAWGQYRSDASELDLSAINLLAQCEANRYCNVAIRVLLADRTAFGIPALLGFYGTLLWLAYVYSTAVALQDIFRSEMDSSMVSIPTVTTLIGLRWVSTLSMFR